MWSILWPFLCESIKVHVGLSHYGVSFQVSRSILAPQAPFVTVQCVKCGRNCSLTSAMRSFSLHFPVFPVCNRPTSQCSMLYKWPPSVCKVTLKAQTWDRCQCFPQKLSKRKSISTRHRMSVCFLHTSSHWQNSFLLLSRPSNLLWSVWCNSTNPDIRYQEEYLAFCQLPAEMLAFTGWRTEPAASYTSHRWPHLAAEVNAPLVSLHIHTAERFLCRS